MPSFPIGARPIRCSISRTTGRVRQQLETACFTNVGEDYYPRRRRGWDVTHQVWRAYMVKEGTDWWVPFYPADNNKHVPPVRCATVAIP